MPLINYETKADFDAAYRSGFEGQFNIDRPNNRPEVKLGYHRVVFFPECEKRADRLIEVFNWPLATRLLVIGAGFGWTAEALELRGYSEVVSVDTSSYVQDNKGGTESAEIDARITAAGLDPGNGQGAVIKGLAHDGGVRSRAAKGILNESMGNQGSINRVKNVLGDIDVAISELMMSTLTDAEAIEVSSRAHDINGSLDVIHFVLTVEQDVNPTYNAKTLAEWKALIPADTFVEASSFRVL